MNAVPLRGTRTPPKLTRCRPKAISIAKRAAKTRATRVMMLQKDGRFVTKEGYLQVVIDKTMFANAARAANQFVSGGQINRLTFARKYKTSDFLAGEAFLKTHPTAHRSSSCRNVFDITTKQGLLRVKVISKCRKRRPRPEYLGNITRQNMEADIDFYVFADVVVDEVLPQNDPDAYEIYLCGWLPREKFHHLLVFFPKNSCDSKDDFVIPEDSCSVPYSKMNNWAGHRILTLSDRIMILQAIVDASDNTSDGWVSTDDLALMVCMHRDVVLKVCREIAWAVRMDSEGNRLTATMEGLSAANDEDWQSNAVEDIDL